MKLSPGVNFINVFRTAFMCVDPKNVKIQSSRQYIFALLGYTLIKAVRKHVGEIDPSFSAENYFWKTTLGKIASTGL